MATPETPNQKTHISGTWKALRSMAVPASVTSIQSSQASAAHPSGVKQISKHDEESIWLKERKAPGYFETADPSLSKS